MYFWQNKSSNTLIAVSARGGGGGSILAPLVSLEGLGSPAFYAFAGKDKRFWHLWYIGQTYCKILICCDSTVKFDE
jgi:hypothetical protein